MNRYDQSAINAQVAYMLTRQIVSRIMDNTHNMRLSESCVSCESFCWEHYTCTHPDKNPMERMIANEYIVCNLYEHKTSPTAFEQYQKFTPRELSEGVDLT